MEMVPRNPSRLQGVRSRFHQVYTIHVIPAITEHESLFLGAIQECTSKSSHSFSQAARSSCHHLHPKRLPRLDWGKLPFLEPVNGREVRHHRPSCVLGCFFQDVAWLFSAQKNCKKDIHKFWHSKLSIQNVIHWKPSTFQSKDFKLPHLVHGNHQKILWRHLRTLTQKIKRNLQFLIRRSQSSAKKLHPLCLVKKEGTCNGVHQLHAYLAYLAYLPMR